MMKHDGTFQEDIQCILPSSNPKFGAIYVSNIQAASNTLTLKKHNIEAVITAIKGKNLSQVIPKHMEYLYIPVIDHQNCDISVFFKDSIQFIDSEIKRTNVLVHCMAGVSRSITLIIAYLIQKLGMHYKQAYQFIKLKRKIIHPNDGFIKQLIEHEKKCLSNQNVKTLKNIKNCPKIYSQQMISNTKSFEQQQQIKRTCKESQKIKLQQTKKKEYIVSANMDYDYKLKQKIEQLFKNKILLKNFSSNKFTSVR